MAFTSFNHFPAIAGALHRAASQIVKETARDIAATYQATAPKDTGFMASTAYIVASDESTYGQGAGTPPGDSYMLPEVSKPDDDLTAYAAVAANYAVYQEFGTRFMPAQPAFYPAVEQAKTTFQNKLDQVEPRIKGIINI